MKGVRGMPTEKDYYERVIQDVKDCQFRCELARRHLEHLQEGEKGELTEVEKDAIEKLIRVSSQSMYRAQQSMFEILTDNRILADEFWLNS